MENINNFLAALTDKLGVPKHDQFQTVDLYEGKNVIQVIDTIFSFSRHAVAKGFDGPLLGPKLADKRVRALLSIHAFGQIIFVLILMMGVKIGIDFFSGAIESRESHLNSSDVR